MSVTIKILVLSSLAALLGACAGLWDLTADTLGGTLVILAASAFLLALLLPRLAALGVLGLAAGVLLAHCHGLSPAGQLPARAGTRPDRRRRRPGAVSGGGPWPVFLWPAPPPAWAGTGRNSAGVTSIGRHCAGQAHGAARWPRVLPKETDTLGQGIAGSADQFIERGDGPEDILVFLAVILALVADIGGNLTESVIHRGLGAGRKDAGQLVQRPRHIQMQQAGHQTLVGDGMLAGKFRDMHGQTIDLMDQRQAYGVQQRQMPVQFRVGASAPPRARSRFCRSTP